MSTYTFPGFLPDGDYLWTCSDCAHRMGNYGPEAVGLDAWSQSTLDGVAALRAHCAAHRIVWREARESSDSNLIPRCDVCRTPKRPFQWFELFTADHSADVYSVPEVPTYVAPAPRDLNPVSAAAAYDLAEIVAWDQPEIAASYAVLVRIVVDQYLALTESGLEIEYVSGEPYANSAEMRAAIAANHHIRTRATEADLSASGARNPMLRGTGTGYMRDGAYFPILVNDMFRTVHDIFGHYATQSGFGPDGETVAWLAHRATFPPEAHLALFLETRGQAAWTNWARDHAELKLSDRPYADGAPRLISPRYL